VRDMPAGSTELARGRRLKSERPATSLTITTILLVPREIFRVFRLFEGWKKFSHREHKGHKGKREHEQTLRVQRRQGNATGIPSQSLRPLRSLRFKQSRDRLDRSHLCCHPRWTMKPAPAGTLMLQRGNNPRYTLAVLRISFDGG